MVKFSGDIQSINWNIYAGHRYSEDASLGTRVTWQLGDLRLGSSLLMESFEFKNREDFWEIDLEYERENLLNLKAQVGRIDNEDDDLEWKDDLDYLTLLEILAIPEIPYILDLTPYLGFSTRNEAEENNFIAGLNIKPVDDVYLKLEYNKDSKAGIKEKIDLQFGYLF